MEISVSQENARVPVTIFQLNGELSGEEPLSGLAKDAYDDGTRYLLLDLSKVPYISSSGLRAIHQVYYLFRGQVSDESEQEVRQGIISGNYKSPNLKLLKPSKNALKALSVSGYDMFLEIHNKKSDALASFE
ncbi:MAG TPA: STAS domain-containing protein [Patescibacteria group bacterium]|nr:STAS domain-containing protein [Patescibacteria group bacterium]